MKLLPAVAGMLLATLAGASGPARARDLAIIYTSDIRGTLGICG